MSSLMVQFHSSSTVSHCFPQQSVKSHSWARRRTQHLQFSGHSRKQGSHVGGRRHWRCAAIMPVIMAYEIPESFLPTVPDVQKLIPADSSAKALDVQSFARSLLGEASNLPTLAKAALAEASDLPELAKTALVAPFYAANDLVLQFGNLIGAPEIANAIRNLEDQTDKLIPPENVRRFLQSVGGAMQETLGNVWSGLELQPGQTTSTVLFYLALLVLLGALVQQPKQ